MVLRSGTERRFSLLRKQNPSQSQVDRGLDRYKREKKKDAALRKLARLQQREYEEKHPNLTRLSQLKEAKQRQFRKWVSAKPKIRAVRVKSATYKVPLQKRGKPKENLLDQKDPFFTR
tara:strand:- start:1097 stop:1450 length:354 start_codon:yes stop_codon:yes gene_type:complete